MQNIVFTVKNKLYLQIKCTLIFVFQGLSDGAHRSASLIPPAKATKRD